MKPIEPVFKEITGQLNAIKDNIQIIAVTKQVDVKRTEEAVHAGILHLGENRPEGLASKLEAIEEDVCWHYIGNLQTRKVKEVINEIDYLHSLDRSSLAKEIQKRASRQVKCFVQINVSGEESKSGIDPANAIDFIESLKDFDKIQVVGLMTMAPNTTDEQIIREAFKGLKLLQLQVSEKHWTHAPCTECSMGMSNDYLIAAQEGATFVRIGTALVGSESEAKR
ncbi:MULTISPECIES: YggS family pyridoxal phosphate-dependent enzyme [Planococcus]|uniref:Pyridoxal phosphate homeostasis protein n=1 Tax=Planococcus faecalis TaxID=1598147 RepID=A0ABM6IW06_9BACL|nr:MULTISPECIES: YggS family pyridoxal phosphate-dependent enzyme [Planococcus]AQU79889.1 YggS family pyridoxal phosphate enzyme [Planococcus faecalis]MDJ0330747.1 YggS family pyridoxal phosphate-dependent enzyme [Planococcus sp. S3-L1]OHX53458.1 YggS family pyridoxal phosphate enzyme [Planococcus faecalis]